MSSQGRTPTIAAALAALAGGMALVGVVLVYLNAGVADPAASFWPLGLVAAFAYGGLGGWLVRTGARTALGWLMLGIGLTQAASLLAGAYGVYVLESHPDLPLGELSLWAGSWLWAPGYVAIPTLLLQVLPDGRPLPGRWRAGLPLGAVAVTLVSVGWALTPYDRQDVSFDVAGATNPVGVAAVAHLLNAAGLPLLVVCAGVSVASLVVRWRRSRVGPVERDRLKWVLVGALGTVSLLGLAFALPGDVGAYVVGLAMLPLPVGCVLAAARYGLWDVDLVINRSLVYGSLTATVVGLYVAVVGLLGGLAGRGTGAPIVATAVVAVLAQPLHLRLQRVVNRLVHGDVHDPYAALARLGEQLEAARDPAAVTEQVLPELVTAVARLLRTPAALVLRDGSEVTAGVVGATPERVPLSYAGELLGELRVGPRTGGFSKSERRLIEGLSRQAAVAVHGVLLGRDLQHSRELLVRAREEERRRLRQDLHDGVGPALAAAGLQVETAREVYARDPKAAAAMLDLAAQRLRGAVDDVRAVVNGLRPATLDDLGLPGALVELAARFETPYRCVAATVADVEGRTAAVDAAAYLVAAEALTNASRHGEATHVELVLSATPGGLLLVITDNGVGIGDAPALGVGLRSMRERAEELAGTLSVGPGPDDRGTRVALRLPLEDA